MFMLILFLIQVIINWPVDFIILLYCPVQGLRVSQLKPRKYYIYTYVKGSFILSPGHLKAGLRGLTLPYIFPHT